MSLRNNVIANYLGQGWVAIMGIAFVPLYIKYLGMEAYGLIGVFAMLQAWLTLLDMGMTPTLTREMARYSAGAHSTESIRDLIRSLEVICFSLAILIISSIWLSASWLSVHWFHSEKLSENEVSQSISIIGCVVAFRFIESLYRGAILGMQRQVWLNVAGSALATLRWGGAVCVLAWVSTDVKAFFVWQGVVSLLTILVYSQHVHRHIPRTMQNAKFSSAQLRNIWNFAGGMMLTTLLSLLLMQIDKIILSRLLSLEMFGYYILASTVASMLYQLTNPISQAYYPRFTAYVTNKDTPHLISIYHQSARIISILVIPATLVLVFFGESVLSLWTGNKFLAHDIAPLMALLAVGTMLNSLMHMPYMLTLAYGWPGFAVRQNIVAVIALVPAILWVAPRYGAIGTAWIWVILNGGYVFIGMHFMHARLLPQVKWSWYKFDVLLPGLSALLIALLCWNVRPVGDKLVEMLWLLISATLMMVGSWAVTQRPHTWWGQEKNRND